MSKNRMRQDCERCGIYAVCDEDGVCHECRQEEADSIYEEQTEKENDADEQDE